MIFPSVSRVFRQVFPLMFRGIKLKRWVFLWLMGSIVLITGVVGGLGRKYQEIHFRIPPLQKVEKAIRLHIKQMRPLDLWLIIIGGAAMILAMRRGYYAILAIIYPGRGSQFMRLAYERARRRRGPKIVAIGGGTGLPSLLTGLKEYSDNLTAVVTVSDDGGSSGRLRRQFDMPPPGDLRNCLVALADSEPLMGQLLQHRFSRKGELQGHTFGNLFLAALAEVSGDFSRAMVESSRVLAVRGRVLPVTLDLVQLSARLKNGKVVKGETRIRSRKSPIESVQLVPARVRPNPEALKEIGRADIIVFGPGSLFTSVVPNLLVPGVKEAITSVRAVKIFVCNVMTEPGETDGFSAADHVDALYRYLGAGNLDGVLLNNQEPSRRQLARYRAEGASLVEIDEERLRMLGISTVKANLLGRRHTFIRHDPALLARAVVKFAVI